MKRLLFIFLIIAFLLSELILSINRNAGFLIYVIIIGILLINLEKDETLSHSEKLLVFLMIVPIARISELFINFSFFWKTVMFYFAISFLVVLYTRRFKINPGYTKSRLWFLPISIIIGICLGYAGSLIFNSGEYLEILFLLPFIVFSEEILFRGMIQNYAKKEYGSIISIIGTSLLFAVFSLSHGFALAYFMFMANIIMCLIYDRTENIWLTLPINLCINLSLFVLPFSRLLILI